MTINDTNNTRGDKMGAAAEKNRHDPASQNFLSVQDVARRYGVNARSIQRWAKHTPDFPKPIQLGGGGVSRWSLADLERWEAERSVMSSARKAPGADQ